jgi:hypothetical protein
MKGMRVTRFAAIMVALCALAFAAAVREFLD